MSLGELCHIDNFQTNEIRKFLNFKKTSPERKKERKKEEQSSNKSRLGQEATNKFLFFGLKLPHENRFKKVTWK